MKTLQTSFVLALSVVTAFAQGPGPGGRGRGGWLGPGMGVMGAGPGSRTPVTGAPYSAVETTQVQQTLDGGNAITRQSQSKVFRDAQGRVRMEHTVTPPGSQAAQTRITIFDPVASASYVLDPTNSSAVKMQVRQRDPNITAGPRAPRMHPEESRQANKEDLGAQSINGVPATGTRMTRTIPAGAIGNAKEIVIVREVWTSTDLKVPVLIKTSDPRFGTTVMQLTNIVRADPDASLFQVPSNYSITSGGGPGMRGQMRQRGPRN